MFRERSVSHNLISFAENQNDLYGCDFISFPLQVGLGARAVSLPHFFTEFRGISWRYKMKRDAELKK